MAMSNTVYLGIVIILINLFRVNVFAQISFSNLSALANRRQVAWNERVDDGVCDLKSFVRLPPIIGELSYGICLTVRGKPGLCCNGWGA